MSPMFMPERWIVLKVHLEGPFVVIDFRALGSKSILSSAVWDGVSALSFQGDLSYLRDLILAEAEKLPLDRLGPHAIFPVPLPVFLDLPRGLENKLYPYIESGLAQLGNPMRFQPVLLHRGKWVRRSLFRLPFLIQTVGPDSQLIGSGIWDASWYFSGPVREFGIRIESGDDYSAYYDIVITNDPKTARAIASTPLEHRPRLLVIWGSSFETSPQAPGGVALCEIAGNQSEATGATRELILGLIHDFPLHEAVASVARKVPTRIRLIADPRSNHSLRILDALESVKREGVRWETKIGAVFTAAAVKPQLSEEAVARAAGVVRNFVRDFKDFERETSGLVPLSNLQAQIEATRSQAAFLTTSLPLNRTRFDEFRELQHRSVDVALERLETEPLLHWLPQSSTLKRGARYQLRLHIGNRLVDSIVSGQIPYLDPLLPDPQDSRGHELEVVIQPKDFRVLSERIQRFYLPLAGASDPVYFRIRAPRKVTQIAQLRILLYYRNHIVQSFLLSAEITEEERTSNESPESLRVSLEFTRTKRFTNLDSLAPRLLSLAINRGADATHNVSVKGESGVDGDVRLDPYTFDERVKELRESLKVATVDPNDSTTARIYPEVTDGQPAPPVMADVIRDLAVKGKKLYDALFDRAAEQNPHLRADLVDVRNKTNQRLQVVRFGYDYVFPWTLLYDYKLPKDRTQGPVCLGQTRDMNGKTEACKHGPNSQIFCVSGFWGIRHEVEEFLGAGSATDSHVALPSQGAAIRIVADAELDQAKKLEEFLSAKVGVKAVTTGPADEEQLITLLWKYPPERPAVLIVLGHMEEQDERIRLARDQQWLSRAELADRAQDEKRAWEQPRSIVLLMACDSGAASLKTVNNFVVAFNTAGAAAVVGTECIVDSQLAAQFAQQISVAMVKDRIRLGAAITEFRRASLQRGNPLAFVFNAIGDVDLRVQ